MFVFILFIESIMLALSLSVDAFAAGFSYGAKKIKLPMLSIQIISMICSSITCISLVLGTLISPYIPKRFAAIMAFLILLIIGFSKLMDSITKSIIRRHNNINKEISISMFNFRFILNLYANPEDADADFSKTISCKEAAALALSLSLDGMIVGFGAALVNANALFIFVWSIISNTVMLTAGRFAGDKAANSVPFNISWLSGVVLMGLAFSKLF